MTNRERMLAVLNGGQPDRLPVIEWATWWDKTVAGWRQENPALPADQQGLFTYFGLDRLDQFWFALSDGQLPPPAHHGAPVMTDPSAFHRDILPHLFCESNLEAFRAQLLGVKPLHDAGETSVWFTLEGFFWFPRTLFGIEEHLYAFFDYPDLMHEINERLADYHLKILEVVYDVLTPEFMTFAEDMSYNHGPMIGRELFEKFMAPYYKKVVPAIRRHGTRVLVDTDGDVEPLIPWFAETGIEGVLPLERQAGVDVVRIRNNHPDWIMLGGYDKTIMHLGEEAMRREFERLLPAMRAGRYIPSVDHQTPPDVSLDTYKTYVRLLKHYAVLGRPC